MPARTERTASGASGLAERKGPKKASNAAVNASFTAAIQDVIDLRPHASNLARARRPAICASFDVAQTLEALLDNLVGLLVSRAGPEDPFDLLFQHLRGEFFGRGIPRCFRAFLHLLIKLIVQGDPLAKHRVLRFSS